MKKNLFITALLLIAGITGHTQEQEYVLDTRIDNNGYWKQAAEKGLTTLNPVVPIKAAIYTGSDIRAVSVITDDSPDVPVVTGSTSQSENSIYVNPNDIENAVNSNNSTSAPGGGIDLYGANALHTYDGGETWTDDISGAGVDNQGDPVSLVNNNGRIFIGYIQNNGQAISYSDDQGVTWTAVQVANSPGGFGSLLDKNHMWIDNSTDSPHEGNLYNAWTIFGGSNDGEIGLAYSDNAGDSWSSTIVLSSNLNAGNHNQGVNISTGPNGEVYALWVIYDSWPADENALAFARSYDGGVTWESFRILDNIRGIRNSGTGKDMRVNAFPCLEVDISNGIFSGNIYAVWTNTGVPGTNQGPDVDVYMIRSEDEGNTWSDPVRVNQDEPNMGKKHYFSWITCDPVTGTLSTVFYDDRNVGGDALEVYCANSYDAGETWEDFKVSDVSFTPSPIPGLASGYFGDYLGISARNGNVYPVWTDNRTGTALTYVSPYQTSVLAAPVELEASLDFETGIVNLAWQHNPGGTFQYYKIYRNFAYLGTSIDPAYTDTLPDYGKYRYRVTAYYTTEGESGPAITDISWGNASIALDPEAVVEYLNPGSSSVKVIEIGNTGELELTYLGIVELTETPEPPDSNYCVGYGGCDEFIANVDYLDVSKYSNCGEYQDHSDLYSIVTVGQSFDIEVINGWDNQPDDLCNVWIDWDGDLQFTDEDPLPIQGNPGIGPYFATASVPEGAYSGMTRMRIRLSRGNPSYACGIAPHGEVEDYGLYIIGWLKVTPLNGDVPAGGSQQLTLEFNTLGLELGTYECIIRLLTNDPENPSIDIPITLHVQNINLSAYADKDELCLGQGTQLHAGLSGGSTNFTFNWTSEPPGFSSTDPDPHVVPDLSTTYHVEATDGSTNLQDEVAVSVMDLPVVYLGSDGGFCENGSYVIDAGEGFVSYLWSDGSNERTLTVNDEGLYWVIVTNESGCSNSDSLNLTKYSLPVINLGDDYSFCENTSTTLNAGPGFKSYLWNTGDETSSIETDQAGEYWVKVTSDEDCSNYDTISLSLDPLPGKSAITSGPTDVDLYATTVTGYTGQEVSDADDYEWNLDPDNAGTISTNGTMADISWNQEFSGTASITLTAQNDCGGGPDSDSYVVTVYNSLDIRDIPGVNSLKIYPNPTDGEIIIRINTAGNLDFTVNVMNMLGNRITVRNFEASGGTNTFRIDLNTAPEGIYTLVITSDGGSLERKLVLRK